MIASICYRAAKTTSSAKEDNNGDAFQRRGSHRHLDRRRRSRAPVTTSTDTTNTTCEPREREVTSPLGGLRILTAAQDHEDVPSTGTNERSSSTALLRERKQQNETRERHERARLSTRRASLPPSFFLLLPSRLLSGTLPLRLPSLLPPLSLSLFLSRSFPLFLFFSLPPSVPFFHGLSFSP